MIYYEHRASSWDAGRILEQLSEEQLDQLRVRLEQEKATSNLLGRKYNVRLLKYVESKLNRRSS